MKKIITNQIRHLRQDRNITSRELASMIGTSAPHMSRLESGLTPLSIDWISKIAGVLKVGTNEIIDLPITKRCASTCDDGLLSSVLEWIMEADVKYKTKLTRHELSTWASLVYKEAVDVPLNYKETEYLAFTLVKIIRHSKK